jgi:hypothetical protein
VSDPGQTDVLATMGRTVASNVRRVASAVCIVGLLAVAWVVPLSRQDVIDSATFSIAFFATLLTGEAVIFALSFAASSAWPSFREIDGHIGFRDWVVTGWLGAMLTASGLLAQAATAATYGAFLFLLADLVGIFSFIRLLGLASSGGRKQLLARTLGRALQDPPRGARQRQAGEAVVAAYLGQLDQSASGSDGGSVQDLVAELASTAVDNRGVAPATQAALALHLEAVHRLAKAALVGKLDPVVASAAARVLVDSLLARVRVPPDGTTPGTARLELAAAVLGQASRYLAWLANTSLILSARQVTTASSAREMVAFAVASRDLILRLADPDPPGAGPGDLGTPLAGPACAVAWLADFTDFHGSHQAAGLYPVYEILTGSKFLGNYFDGDSILSGLRSALFSGPPSGLSAAAQATRHAFGTVTEFDLTWTLVSVGAIATLRDVRIAHPPELIRPEFSPDHQLLAAYLRTFAAHRFFSTAEQATTTLTSLVSRTSAPGEMWHQVCAIASHAGWTGPVPIIEPRQRLSACVLAVASRLAPLDPLEPDRELRAFLAALPLPLLEATGRLAARVMPVRDTPRAGQDGVEQAISERLRILHLIGASQTNSP